VIISWWLALGYGCTRCIFFVRDLGSEHEDNDETDPDEEKIEEAIENIFCEMENDGELDGDHNVATEVVLEGSHVEFLVEQI
jgi:hypothetical protein